MALALDRTIDNKLLFDFDMTRSYTFSFLSNSLQLHLTIIGLFCKRALALALDRTIVNKQVRKHVGLHT